MCGHSNTFVFASTANLWFAINHSIRPTLPPNAALWRRVSSCCIRSGHVSVTHIPLHKGLQHTLPTHLPHISRGECLFCSTQQILTYSTCTLHKSIHMQCLFTLCTTTDKCTLLLQYTSHLHLWMRCCVSSKCPYSAALSSGCSSPF